METKEALMIGGGLLTTMPELKTERDICWSESGAGESLKSLCALLEGNAIPTKILRFEGKKQAKCYNDGE